MTEPLRGNRPSFNQLNRNQMQGLYLLFEKFALDDWRTYYISVIARHRKAAAQVNFIRALCAFLAGLAAALAGLVVQSTYVDGVCAGVIAPDKLPYCQNMNVVTGFLMLTAVVAPALGGAFSTLADLYQWDRQVMLYEDALKNMAIADARSPDPEMDDVTYGLSMKAYAFGSLSVMYDEAAQWGQIVRTPQQIDEFLERARARAESLQLPNFGTRGGTSSPTDATPRG